MMCNLELNLIDPRDMGLESQTKWMWLLLAQLAIPGVEAKSHSMHKWHQKNGSCENLYPNFLTFDLPFYSYI